MIHDPKKPVSLEDLLHLKRSERPPEQFWVQFESELRAKQLAAIVQHRPWWSSWERIFQGVTRQSLPIGATAVLAIGLLSFHEYRAHSIEGGATVSTISPAVVAELSHEPAPKVSVPGAVAVAASVAVRQSAKTVPVIQTRSVAVTVDSANDPFSALVGGSQKSPAPASIQSDTWSHFGDQQLAANTLSSTVGFAPRAFATLVSEPLTQVAGPVDENRARLLSGSLPPPDNAAFDDSLAPSTDDRANRLSEERLYESVSRYGSHVGLHKSNALISW